MQRFLFFAKALAFVAIAVFFAALTRAVWQVPGIVNAQLTGLRADTDQQAARTRQQLLAAIQPAIAQFPALVQQVSFLRADAARLGDRVVDVADKHLDRVTGNIVPVIANLNQAVGDARPAIQNVGLMTADVRAAIRPELECQGNGSCWPSQVTGILGSVKTGLGEGALTMRSWRKATPEIAANVSAITGNANKLSKPHWYTRVATFAVPIVGGILAARLAR
jgi:hypothetical protein